MMGTDVRELVKRKAEALFKDAELNVEFRSNRVVLRAGGLADDLSSLLSKISEFIDATGKLLRAPNVDLILSCQGLAYSFEVEIY